MSLAFILESVFKKPTKHGIPTRNPAWQPKWQFCHWTTLWRQETKLTQHLTFRKTTGIGDEEMNQCLFPLLHRAGLFPISLFTERNVLVVWTSHELLGGLARGSWKRMGCTFLSNAAVMKKIDSLSSSTKTWCSANTRQVLIWPQVTRVKLASAADLDWRFRIVKIA